MRAGAHFTSARLRETMKEFTSCSGGGTADFTEFQPRAAVRFAGCELRVDLEERKGGRIYFPAAGK
jgi:hypothetical protein